MPYIDREDRPDIDVLVDQLDKLMETSGDCNYAITRLLHTYLKKKTLRYHNINEVVGILECAKLEFYAMIAQPYEQQKAAINGSVGVLSEVENLTLAKIDAMLNNLRQSIQDSHGPCF